MRLFKKKHKHDWVIVDKRIFNQEMVSYSIFHKPYEFVVSGVATLEKCKGCGKERAMLIPNGKDWWRSDLKYHFGEIDPFLYRSMFSITDEGPGG